MRSGFLSVFYFSKVFVELRSRLSAASCWGKATSEPEKLSLECDLLIYFINIDQLFPLHNSPVVLCLTLVHWPLELKLVLNLNGGKAYVDSLVLKWLYPFASRNAWIGSIPDPDIARVILTRAWLSRYNCCLTASLGLTILYQMQKICN